MLHVAGFVIEDDVAESAVPTNFASGDNETEAKGTSSDNVNVDAESAAAAAAGGSANFDKDL